MTVDHPRRAMHRAATAGPVVLGAILAAALATTVASAPAEAGTLASVLVDPGYAIAPTTPTGHYTFVPGATATDSLTSGTAGSGSAYYDATAWAIADYGVLKTYASATIEAFPYQDYGTPGGGPAGSGSPLTRLAATAHAEVTDGITITGGTGTGYLKLNLTTDGTSTVTTSSGSGLYAPSASGILTVEGPSSAIVNSWGFGSGTHAFTTSLIMFTYGTPFALTLMADAQVDPSDKMPHTGTYDFSGTADFGHTITLDNFAIYSDAGGTDLVSGTTASGSGGANYATLGATPTNPVPEPASLAILGVALAGLGLTRRRG